MFALALTLIVSAAADVVVVERSTLGLPAPAGAELRTKLAKALEDVSVKAEVVNETCADRACLQSLARERKRVVVGMTIVKSKKGVTVDLDAVDGEAVVLQQTFLVSNVEKFERSPEAQVFAHQLSTRLLKDAPVAENPKPEVEKPPVKVVPQPEWVDTSRAAPSAAPKVIGFTSLGVGVVGIALLIAGAVAKGQLDAALAEQPVVTTLTRPQALERAGAANALLGTGSVAIGLGVSGAITAAVLGASESSPPPLVDED
ncbi:MAG: hypothetical protein JNM17_25610 [Archangium sp.]|nr:hypothetical protein [Archangium sp.]